MESFEKYFAIIGAVITLATAIVGLAKIIARLTPSPKDDTIVAKIASILEVIISIIKKGSIVK